MNDILEAILGGAATAADWGGYALDTPGALTRGLLSGRPGTRASGREMLEQWGAIGPNEDQGWTPDAGDIAGFAAENVVDPMNWIGLGQIGRLLGLAKKTKAANAASDVMCVNRYFPEELLELQHPSMREKTWHVKPGHEDDVRKTLYDQIMDRVAGSGDSYDPEMGHMVKQDLEHEKYDLVPQFLSDIKSFDNPGQMKGFEQDHATFKAVQDMLERREGPTVWQHATLNDWGGKDMPDPKFFDPNNEWGPLHYQSNNRDWEAATHANIKDAEWKKIGGILPGSEEKWMELLRRYRNAELPPGLLGGDDVVAEYLKKNTQDPNAIRALTDKIAQYRDPGDTSADFVKMEYGTHPANVRQAYNDVRNPLVVGDSRDVMLDLKKTLEGGLEKAVQEYGAQSDELSPLVKHIIENFGRPESKAAYREALDPNFGYFPGLNHGETIMDIIDDHVGMGRLPEVLKSMGYDAVQRIEGKAGNLTNPLRTINAPLDVSQVYLPHIAPRKRQVESILPMLSGMLLGYNALTNTHRTVDY